MDYLILKWNFTNNFHANFKVLKWFFLHSKAETGYFKCRKAHFKNAEIAVISEITQKERAKIKRREFDVEKDGGINFLKKKYGLKKIIL